MTDRIRKAIAASGDERLKAIAETRWRVGSLESRQAPVAYVRPDWLDGGREGSG